MCAMVVMTATKVQADIISKDALNQSKLKNLWGSLKDAVGSESKKKTKKGDENENIIEAQSYWEALKIFAEQQQPEIDINISVSPESGSKLLKTETVCGLKCEIYKIGTSRKCIFYKDNGDFFSTRLTPEFDAFLKEKEELDERVAAKRFEWHMNRFSNACDLWRITDGDNVYYGGFKYNDKVQKSNNNNSIFKMEIIKENYIIKQYPNGNQEYWRGGGASFYDFINGHSPMDKSSPYFTFEGVRLASEGLKKYHNAFDEKTYTTRRYDALDEHSIVNRSFDYKFRETVLIDDKLYAWDDSKGELGQPIAQIFGKWAVFNNLIHKAAKNVVSVEEVKVEENTNTFPKITNSYPKITYDNGDFCVLRDNRLYNAKLHIGNSVLILENFKNAESDTAHIDYPDGRIFTGRVKHESKEYRGEVNELTVLMADNLVPDFGLMHYAQGKDIVYVNGMPQEEYERMKKERAESIQREAKKQRAQEAEKERQARESLEKKYGKKWVDMILSVGVRAGMPWELVARFYNAKLSIDHGSRQCYDLHKKYITYRQYNNSRKVLLLN